MDGIELVKRLKASGTYMPTAVALTGFSDLSMRDAYALGIESQLSKPVSRKVLVSALTKALTDREELWALPFHRGARPKFTLKFDSLQAALKNHQVAFGRGGFCVRAENIFSDNSAIEFHLAFDDNQQDLVGQGIVRWTAELERIVGIEIERVQENSRTWLARLARENPTLSFIPRNPDGS